MSYIKKGDIVGRKSYGKDIIFVVTNIIDNQKSYNKRYKKNEKNKDRKNTSFGWRQEI